MNMETPDWEWVEAKMQLGPWESLTPEDQQALSPWYNAEDFNRERALLFFAQKGFREDKATIVPPFSPDVRVRKSAWRWWPWMGLAAACLSGVWWWLGAPEKGKEIAYQHDKQVETGIAPSPAETSGSVEQTQTTSGEPLYRNEDVVVPAEAEDLVYTEMEESETTVGQGDLYPTGMATPAVSGTMTSGARKMEMSAPSTQRMPAVAADEPIAAFSGENQNLPLFSPPVSWTVKDSLMRGDTLFIRFSRRGQRDTLIPALRLRR